VALQNTSLSGWWRYAVWTKVEILLRHHFFLWPVEPEHAEDTLCGHTRIGHWFQGSRRLS
jgi:hypothetical protein